VLIIFASGQPGNGQAFDEVGAQRLMPALVQLR
jgi:hypothetical protein